LSNSDEKLTNDSNSKHAFFDKKLDGLRAICALTVALGHVFYFRFFSAGGTAYNYIQFSREAVLIFFIISGYVIGLHHIQTPFNYNNAVIYFKKRLVRLYPIYLLALIISFAIIFPVGFSLHQFIGHLFFTQEFLVKTVSTNQALWSLSYEAVYYILFLGLWITNKHNIYICLFLSVAISIYVIFSGHDIAIFGSVLIGWIFWMAGLYISQQPIAASQSGSKRVLSPLISYFAVLLATNNLDTRGLVLRSLHLNLSHIYKIDFGDLVFLPVCALIVIDVTNRSVKFKNYLKIVVYAIPALHILTLVYFKHPIYTNLSWEFGAFYFALAILMLPVKINPRWLEKLSYPGKISYAVYVFHLPIAIIVDVFLGKYLSGMQFFVAGFITWAVVTIALSVFTENILQPHIKNYFFHKRKALQN